MAIAILKEAGVLPGMVALYRERLAAHLVSPNTAGQAVPEHEALALEADLEGEMASYTPGKSLSLFLRHNLVNLVMRATAMEDQGVEIPKAENVLNPPPPASRN